MEMTGCKQCGKNGNVSMQSNRRKVWSELYLGGCEFSKLIPGYGEGDLREGH